MADPWGPWLSLAAALPVLLLAAKAHGRQVRLEREAQGFFEVRFGAENPPAVEAVWARDRRTFWPVFALALGALLAARFGAGGPWPLPWGAPAPEWLDALFAAAWALVAAFLVAGLASLARLLGTLAGAAGTDAAWRAEALQGSAFWWALALGGAGTWWSLAAFAG